MPNRTAKSAIIVSLCAGILLAASLRATPVRAADDCLSEPKGATPEGSHWHYHIERPSNRHCWYLRGEADGAAKTSSSSLPAPAKPKPDAAMPGSVANARAELPSRSPIDQDRAANTGQVPAAANAPSSAAAIVNAPAAPAPDPHMMGSVVASRWPDQLGANPAAAPPNPAPASAPANPPADLQANAATPQQPAATVAPPATADAAMAKQSDSAVMLLAVIVGALSVAGLAASAVFRFGGKPRRDRGDLSAEPHPIRDIDRDLERDERPRPLPFPAASVHRPNIGAPLELQQPELQQADDPDEQDRIAQMLTRLARSAQA